MAAEAVINFLLFLRGKDESVRLHHDGEFLW